jgi:hypothetical protein
MKLHAPLFIFFCGIFIACFCGFRFLHSTPKVSANAYARSKVYTLHSSKGTCTGVAVRGPSGKSYILTASHCKPLIDSIGNIIAVDEELNTFYAKVIKEDPYSDLLLLEGQGIEGVEVASQVEMHQHVWTMTHGHAEPSHRSDGEILQASPISFALGQLETPEDIEKCTSLPKQQPTISINEDGLALVCILSEIATATTAAIQPGSSGGPMFNDQSQLVGIASATDGTFSFWVTLQDIHRFMRNY